MTTTDTPPMTWRERRAARRAAYRERRRQIELAYAQGFSDKKLKKALRRAAPNATEVLTHVSTWTEAEWLMSAGWELVSSEQRQWAGSDNIGRSAVLRKTL